MEKVKGYEIDTSFGISTLYAGQSTDDIKTALDQVVDIDELEVGEYVTIKVVEHTREELDNLPEFGGF